MSCAESTTRLLLRNLESDGWIRLFRDAKDQRLKEFEPTEKFNRVVMEWLRVVVPLLIEARDHLEKLAPASESPAARTGGAATADGEPLP